MNKALAIARYAQYDCFIEWLYKQTIKLEMMMKIFRVTGVNKQTGYHEAANVMADDHVQAVKLMAMSHVRVVCINKTGIQQ